MKEITASEIIFFSFFYGVALLAMPFILFIALGILLFPLVILNSVGNIPDTISSLMELIFPIIRIILTFGIFLLYFFSTKKIIKKYGKPRVGLFTVIFVSSVVINFFFSYIICAISMLMPCDPTQYLTFTGFIEIYEFYIIGLVAYISANGYLRYISRNSKF